MDPLFEAKGTFMPVSEYELPLDHQVPVIAKKTQMNGDHGGGSQCGLSSLLPMSCRGRAAAFARDLQSRLRNLGASQDPSESNWTHPQPPTRDLETFFDFELECESPSSPVDEFEPPNFPDRSSAEEHESFYEAEPEPNRTEAEPEAQKTEKPRNGFTFSTAFFTDCPLVKSQPIPRENGHADKRLYTAITFEGCERQNSRDEIDTASLPSALERLSLPLLNNLNQDSDSDFESAKSEPSDVEYSQNDKRLEPDLPRIESLPGLSDAKCAEAELPIEEDVISIERISERTSIEDKQQNVEVCKDSAVITEIDISEVCPEKESSPCPEIEPTLLSAEIKSDDQDDDDRPQRLRRCSSLKTGKTPPGTPGRKKIVRFADVLGLDLADVKTFMDEIPVIPKSAYDDLTGCDVASSPPARPAQRFGALTLVPLFQIPREISDILQRRNVCLESARVADGVHVTVCGSVRVRNLDFHKTVHIRYTMNRWKTYTDLQATYVQGSCDGYSDRFQFVLYAPCISSGQRLELAVRFQCKGQQIWDNNCGANYCFDCLALGATLPLTGAPLAIPSASSPLHPTVDWHPSFY